VGSDPYPAENILFAWADYNAGDLDYSDLSDLDWHFTTFPMLDRWNAADPEWGRFFHSTVVKDNNVYIIGTRVDIDTDAEFPEKGDSLMIYWNTNYAEGDSTAWNLTIVPGISDEVTDPILPGETSGYYESINPMYWDYVFSGHYNCALDEAGRIHFVSSQSLNATTEADGDVWFPTMSCMVDTYFDPATNQFTQVPLYPQNASSTETDDDGYALNPYPYCPWDMNVDGEIDTIYTDPDTNTPYIIPRAPAMPIYYWNIDLDGIIFNENYCHVTSNTDKGWLAAVWSDSYKAYQYNKYSNDDYADYASAPETMISISADNGKHWSDPIVLSSVETPELDGMVPEYIYPSEMIFDLGNNQGRLDLFFLDDNEYGSNIQGVGGETGGMLKYASMSIDFSQMPAVGNTDQTAPQAVRFGMTNSPNPFNPETKINFSLANAGQTELKVYNVRGELVKTLLKDRVDAGSHTLYWNGTSDNGSKVASGVYFCKIKQGKNSETHKMLLLK
jgi:hypothetical protein